jgi:Xaa-Pro aminopeptidase
MLLNEITGHKDVNWQQIEKMLPFGGIRIEDNVVVKAKEPLNLSR